MKLRLFCGGNCALRFKEDIIRAIGKTKPVAAIFVGATVQEYDGGRGLAGGAACSWYVDEDIVDINIFLASLPDAFQPIRLALVPMLFRFEPKLVRTGLENLLLNWPHSIFLKTRTLSLDVASRYQECSRNSSGGILVAIVVIEWLKHVARPMQTHIHIPILITVVHQLMQPSCTASR